jgi:hypothetical protein
VLIRVSASFQQLTSNIYMAARVCASLYTCSWFVGLHALLLSSPDSYLNDTDAMLRPCVSNTSMWCPSSVPDAGYDESTAIVRCVLPWGQVEQPRPLADAWVDIIGNETFNGSLIDITWQHTPRASKTTSVAIATKTASYQGIFVWGSIGGIATVLICGSIYTRVRRRANKGRLDKQRPSSIIDAIQWGNPHDDAFINNAAYFPTNNNVPAVRPHAHPRQVLPHPHCLHMGHSHPCDLSRRCLGAPRHAASLLPHTRAAIIVHLTL